MGRKSVTLRRELNGGLLALVDGEILNGVVRIEVIAEPRLPAEIRITFNGRLVVLEQGQAGS